MNILKANGVDLAYDSFGGEIADAILIAGLGTRVIRWTVLLNLMAPCERTATQDATCCGTPECAATGYATSG